MKKVTSLIITALVITATSCRTDSPQLIALAESLKAKQQSCLDLLADECKPENAHCFVDSCLLQVRQCHRIDRNIFDTLVENRGSGHEKPFSDIKQHIDQADCETQRFRVWFNFFGTLKMNVEDKAQTITESFYSIALLKAIELDAPVSFTFYKGINLDDGSDIVPFKVEFENGTIEYYDVSDTEP